MIDFNPIEWITTGEAAELTGYTSDYIRKAIRRGLLEGMKRGRDWFLNKADVLAYKEKMDALGDRKHNPWREDHKEQGRGRRPDETDNGAE